MKNNQRGITLIALIITIVILLILAVVAISAVSDNKLIEKTDEATKIHEIKEEEERIQLELNEWTIQKYMSDEERFESFLKRLYGDSNVQSTTTQGSYIVTTQKGNQFIVTEDGSTHIEEVKDGKFISLDKTSLTGNSFFGTIEIGQLTVTTNIDASELVWTVTPADSGVTLTGEGNTRTVTASNQGEFKIIVSYEDDSSIKAECDVTVTYSKPGAITFYIDETSYTAVQGVTWEYWIEQLGGNTKGYIVRNNRILYSSNNTYIAGVNSTDIITQNKSYYTE